MRDRSDLFDKAVAYVRDDVTVTGIGEPDSGDRQPCIRRAFLDVWAFTPTWAVL